LPASTGGAVHDSQRMGHADPARRRGHRRWRVFHLHHRPGERACRYWEAARARGLRTVAKIQCGNTWELSAVPYIPAVANVARHAANLRSRGVNGLMLGWTLGGYPSPNLEVVAELGAASAVARRRTRGTPWRG